VTSSSSSSGSGSGSRVLTLVLAILVVVATMSTSSLARADEAAARQHFRRGVELYDKKQYAPALEAFEAAYAEKPSPGIKQNIALSLKGLGRPLDAVKAFDEALDEGEGTLKPETRAAIELELAELSKIVATVRLKVVAAVDKRPIDKVAVTIDGAPIAPNALRRPLRLAPGIHVFTAHAEGFADPPEKKLSILAGSPVDATFELSPPLGILTVKPSVADAAVQIDGVEVGRGVWSGKLAAGTHRITVSAPEHQTAAADVVVSSGATVDYPMTLQRIGDLPPLYSRPVRKPPPPEQKKRYLVPMIAYEGQSFRFAPILGENAGGTKRQLTGASVALRAGYRVSRPFALEIYGDVGQLGDTYNISSGAAESTTKVIHWQVTPGLRFATGGAVRFTMGTGVGMHGLIADADIATVEGVTPVRTTHKGTGIAASWLVDMGLQVDVGSLFIEAVAFFDMHGVGTTRDDVTNDRLFLGSPGTRAGIRAGLGIQF
jgi:hypothetical protein